MLRYSRVVPTLSGSRRQCVFFLGVEDPGPRNNRDGTSRDQPSSDTPHTPGTLVELFTTDVS